MKIVFRLIDGAVIAAGACAFGIFHLFPGFRGLIPVIVLLFLAVNIIPSPTDFTYKRRRLKVCASGVDLLFGFLLGSAITLAAHLAAGFFILPFGVLTYFFSCVISCLVLLSVFCNGIIRVYLTSVQLGIKHRVIGALCGWVPIVNLIVLHKIIRICSDEVEFENYRDLLNESRKNDAVCQTKYPLLFVHGVFFRDSEYFNYWGRIPDDLILNGATVFYGNNQSANSIADGGAELTETMRRIVRETGCGKLNIIAHSKGGLDCRYAISKCGAEPYVASLTTINTPHRGCLFADYLLEKVPNVVRNAIAGSYNSALKRFGDTSPDFLSAVYDLRSENCRRLNREISDSGSVYYQSVGSKLNKASGGKFPLNFTYPIAKFFDGPNDGLVSEYSCEWGEKFTFLTTDKNRGISHGDMIDLNRENIKGFDVREFYVQLVADLKKKGF